MLADFVCCDLCVFVPILMIMIAFFYVEDIFSNAQTRITKIIIMVIPSTGTIMDYNICLKSTFPCVDNAQGVSTPKDERM